MSPLEKNASSLEIARIQVEHIKEFWAVSARISADMNRMAIRSQLIEFAYRMTVLAVGSGFAYMGYRLFLAGILGQSELKAGSGEASLSLNNAAPGLFFALFGTALIITGIWKLLPLPREVQPSVQLEPPSNVVPAVGEMQDRA